MPCRCALNYQPKIIDGWSKKQIAYKIQLFHGFNDVAMIPLRHHLADNSCRLRHLSTSGAKTAPPPPHSSQCSHPGMITYAVHYNVQSLDATPICSCLNSLEASSPDGRDVKGTRPSVSVKLRIKHAHERSARGPFWCLLMWVLMLYGGAAAPPEPGSLRQVFWRR